MAQPFNYLVNTDLTKQFAGLSEALQQRQERVKEETDKVQMQNDWNAAQQKGDTKAYFDLMIKYPKFANIFEMQRKTVGEEKTNNEFMYGSKVLSALENGNPDIAKQLLTDKVAALKEAGQPTDTYSQILTAIDNGNVDVAKSATNQALMFVSPEKYKLYAENKFATAEEKRKEELFPLQKRRGEAEVQTAETTAKYAEPKAQSELETAKAQRAAWENDTKLKRAQLGLEQQRIQIAREDNAIKRQQLQLDYDAKQAKFQSEIGAKVDKAKSSFDSASNGIDLIDELLSKNNAGDFNRTVGPVASRLPTVSQGAADIEAKLETLKSKLFLESISAMKGLGALSDKEGAKLQASIANLSTSQSPESLRKNLQFVRNTLDASQSKLSSQYGFKTETSPSSSSKPKPISVDY